MSDFIRTNNVGVTVRWHDGRIENFVSMVSAMYLGLLSLMLGLSLGMLITMFIVAERCKESGDVDLFGQHFICIHMSHKEKETE